MAKKRTKKPVTKKRKKIVSKRRVPLKKKRHVVRKKMAPKAKRRHPNEKAGRMVSAVVRANMRRATAQATNIPKEAIHEVAPSQPSPAVELRGESQRGPETP